MKVDPRQPSWTLDFGRESMRRAPHAALFVGIVCTVWACTAHAPRSGDYGSSRQQIVEGVEAAAAATAALSLGAGESGACTDSHAICLEYVRVLRDGPHDEQAYEQASDALQRFPSCVELLELRGDVAAELGFHRAAQHDYECAAVLAPECAMLWEKLGRVRLELDLPAGARLAFTHSVELGPATLERLEGLAIAQANDGEPLDAARTYVRARALAAQPDAMTRIAALGVEDAIGVERALAWVDSAARAHPECADVEYVRGQILESVGRSGDAIPAYERALITDASHLPTLVRLAQWSLANGHIERGRMLARRALALRPDAATQRSLRESVAKASS